MIQVIHRALDILEYVALHAGESVSLRDISDQLKLNQATCANIIKTLTTRKYLEHIGPKKGYRLGTMAEFLIGSFSLRYQLLVSAKDTMDNLTTRLNESSILGVIHNDKRLVIYTATSDHDLTVRSKPQRDVYETASGRIILSFYPEADINAFVERNGLPKASVWKGTQTKSGLLNELKKIRKAELVLTRSANHIVGLAVPIKKDGGIVASLSIYLPESRFSVTLEKDIIKNLREAGEEISRKLSSL